MRERFPAALSPNHPGDVLAIRNGAQIVAALLIRRFDWHTGADALPAAMIGMVATHPDHRRRGLARALLDSAHATLKSEGRRFAVLWTGQPGVYASHGWVAADCGVVATVQGDPAAVAAAAAPATLHVGELVALRRRFGENSMSRSSEGWYTLPPHADTLEAFVEPGGYALAGVRDSEGFVYEIMAEEAALPRLFARLRARFSRFTLNGKAGGGWETWAAQHGPATWRPQSLAMWLPMDPSLDVRAFNRWYVPLPDRI